MAKSINRLMAELVEADGDIATDKLDNAPQGLDSAQVTTIATDASINVYTGLDSLPTSNLTAGDQAFVESNQRLYISNGSGWYNVALVNATPTLTLDPSGAISLNADTLTATVTITATDSDNPESILTFSVESDGNMVGTGTTVSQDSSVFTITALSEDSGATAGSFTLTFKASDGINFGTDTTAFTLSFSNYIDSSSTTVYMMKALDSGYDNTTITYLDSAEASQTFSSQNQVASTSFSPYRDAGYSAYFDNTTYNADWLEVAHDDGLSVEDSDFTIEGWFYMESWPSNAAVFGKWHQGSIANRNEWLLYYNSGLKFIYSTNGQSTANTLNGGTPSLREWHHFAITRTGGTITYWLDGSSVATQAETSSIFKATATTVRVGRFNSGGGFNGYAFDYRIVKGTALYTSAFTPPTEKLTAVTGTQLLFLRKGHFGYADESGNNHKVVKNVNVQTRPKTPYDYQPWVADNHGGSLYSGSNDWVETPQGTSIANFGTGDFTIDCWWYPITAVSTTVNPFVSTTDGGNTTTTLDLGYSSDKFTYTKGTTTVASTTNLAEPGSWYHIVLQRSSSSTNMWVNGERVISGNSDTQNYSVDEEFQIMRNRSNNQDINGYMADVRVVKGSAVYTVGDTITVPTSPVSHVSGTTMLMQNKDVKMYDAASANAIIIDQSAGAGAYETTTDIRKFTGSSAIRGLGLSSHQGLLIAERDHAEERFNFGPNDLYTIEGWVYLVDHTNQVWYGSGGQTASWNTASGLHQMIFISSNTIYYQYNKGGNGVQSLNAGAAATYMATGSWHHIAATHDGTTHRIFINGTSRATSTQDIAAITSPSPFRVRHGHPTNTGYEMDGYMQGWRVKKGQCLYTSDFTPSTTEFEL